MNKLNFLQKTLMKLRRGHDARAVANLFVEQARATQSSMGVMTLIKYVYLAHGWTLAYTDRPLIKQQVEAWRYGPVVPEVYRAFSWQRILVTEKAHGYHPEFGEFPAYSCKLSTEEQDIVSKVFERYSRFDAFQLTAILTETGSPWEQTKGQLYNPIPNELIKAHYRSMITRPGVNQGERAPAQC